MLFDNSGLIAMTGDLNGDGLRDAADLSLFADHLGSNNGSSTYNSDADLEPIGGDGDIDGMDLHLFSSILGVSAPLDRFLYFDADGDTVVISDDASLDITGGITVEAWVRPEAIPALGENARLVSKGNEYELMVHSADSTCANGTTGDVQWRSVIGGVDARICGGSLTMGQWHHIAGTYDGNVFVLYVDSVQAAFIARSGPIGTNDNPVAVGSHPTLSGPFNGDIDDLRIWNRALSAAEIKSGALVELSGNENGLMGYFLFNEGAGQVAHDDSGSGNNGRLGMTDDLDSGDPTWYGPIGPLNQAPVVVAGTSQSAMLPYAVVALNGTVTDDGMPGGGLASAWGVVSGPAAVVFGNSTAVDTTASFPQAGTYELRLTVDDGELAASDDVTIVISEDASSLDIFETDTTSSYTQTNTFGEGGSLSYDAGRQQALMLAGNDDGFQISKAVSFVDRGLFSLVFEPTVNYPSGGSIYLRLKEDDNNYLEIKNTDGYGPGYLHKVVGGALVDTADFRSEYSQGAAYEIFVYFTPQATMVEGFDQTVAITADPTSLTINSFEIELRQQDAYLDNIALQNLRYSKLVNLRDGYWQNTTDLPVKVIAANLEPGWAVRFTLDDSVSAPRVFEQPVSGGPFLFETVFAGIPKTEYRLDTEVLDENSLEILDAELIDAAVPVTIGDYYISVGASMARGSHDDIFYDNVSADGRDSGGGFGPILNDLLTAAKGYPHTVPSEGVSGHTTLDGMDVIDSVLVKHPYARYVLLLYGTNDAQLVPPTPDGLGLPPGHVDYPGSYKANMQAIIDVIVSDGKFPYLAKLPIAYGPFAGLNPQLQIYNDVIDELAAENGIQVAPPDLYGHFADNPDEIDDDGLHPNGMGYQSIAALWRDAIMAVSPPP